MLNFWCVCVCVCKRACKLCLRVQDNGIVNLCYELQGSHHFELKVLDLSQNQITDVGAKTLVTFMQQFRNLKYLNLEDNLS